MQVVEKAVGKWIIIAALLNNLLTNEVEYKELQQNCLAARQELNWQQEEKKLIEFYKNLFG